MKLEIKNLTKIYSNRSKKIPDVTAVNDFTYTVPDGKLVALLGPSGCGKSTTLHLICGLEKPNSGKIFFGDDDVTDLPPENRGVGIVFQSYAIYPHLTVRGNIMFPLQNFKGKDKLTKEEMDRRVLEAAELVQIEKLLDRKPSELSGGQRQRVAIARALVKLPRVLLLDEPLSNLDARLRLQTREELRRIQKSTGITTIFVTHDQEEAMSISDLIIVMKDGVIQQSDMPQKVYDDPVNLFVAKFLGTPPVNVFKGRVKGETLYLGEDAALTVPGVPDGDVKVGIRPEGFVPQPDGKVRASLKAVEVMGRDTSVVIGIPAAVSDPVRAIISSEHPIPAGTDELRFDLKPNKVLLFDSETEQRIRFDTEG